MTQFDLETLLTPLSEDAPAGENLEYDPGYLALERAAAPKAERAVGDSVKAAEEPDWEVVVQMATATLARSRDLRAAVHLTTGWLRTTGMNGWLAGLTLIHGLLEQYWDTVHPQLDAEDDNDPTARVNALAPLCDPRGVLGYFRSTPFVQSPRLGRFALRDLRHANGTLKYTVATGEPDPAMTDLEACCMDCAEGDLTGVAAAIDGALEQVKAIDGIFSEQLGTAGPDFKILLSDTFELQKFLQAQLARRFPQADAAEDDGTGATVDGTSGGAAATNNKGITSTQDVIRRIDELCEYYVTREPSSPVPLLLRRAQRLVGMNFVDLLNDLAPGGISELQVIAGATEESE